MIRSESRMTWLQRYQLKRTVRWSLWLLPVLTIGLVLVVAPLIRWLDRATGWTWFNLAPESGPGQFWERSRHRC